MHLAPGWETAAAAAAALAVVALAARAVTASGAVAGLAVGVATAAGFGWPGLAVLGTFFVVGTVATRVGYARKQARGAAEARGGARDWRNVVGKGGVAAAVALWQVFETETWLSRSDLQRHVVSHGDVYAGAVAAALADTLGTELGLLTRGAARMPWPPFARVPHGTPGAVSGAGLVAAGAGAALVAWVANAVGVIPYEILAVYAACCGVVASLAESWAVVAGLRAPGFVRNLLTTGAGAGLVAIGIVRVVR